MFKIIKKRSRDDSTPRSVVRLFVLTSVFLAVFAGVFSYTRMGAPTRVYAATSSNLNYQARLLSSNGNIVPDGYYNLEFKLYSSSTGGSALWTERYHDTNGPTAGGDNRIRVVNGYLSVNLASITAFPTNIDWDQDMWLTMNVGGAAQTATPTFDGEMSPRIKLTAVPYAFQAKSASQLQQTQGSYTGTLGFNSLSANRTINAPDESGTLCIQGSGNCGFVVGTAANFIQNGTTPQTGNFNITGNGTLGGALGVGGNLTFTNPNASIINRAASANSSAILVARVSTDAQDKFRLEANGRMYWGNGTDALDTTLYRVGVNTLQTDGSFTTGGTLYAGGAGVSLTGVGGSVLKGYSTSGTVNQNDVVVLVNSSGAKVATSTTPRDTRIVGVYRGNSGSASGSVALVGDAPVNVTAGVVNVGDQLVVSSEAGRAMVDNNATSGILGYAISFKAAGSPGSVTARLTVVNGNTNPYYQVNDYRIQNAAGSSDLLRIDGTNERVAIGPSAVPANSILTIGTNTTNAAGGVTFGTDTTLYRSGVGYLRTNGSFQIGGSRLNLLSDSSQITFGAGSDTNLYRSAANTLATDDSFSLLGTGSNLTVQGTGTSSFAGALTVAGMTTLGGNLTLNGSQFTNNASTLNTAGTLGNFPTGGVVGSAATTVDIKTTLAIAQTTAGQTLSLPSPTDATAGRVMYVLNTGTTPFDMHGVTISNGYGQIYVWNGSAWILGASGGGSAITLQSAYDGGSSINTSNARDIAFNLADTTTDGNFLVNIASGSTGRFKVQNNSTDVLTIGATGQLALSVQGSGGGLVIGGDTSLYRSAANTLRTDSGLQVFGQLTAAGLLNSTGAIIAQRVNSTDRAIDVQMVGDTGPRMRVTANGSIAFGSGGGTVDTNLYRSAANTLATDDSFLLAGSGSNLTVQGTGTSTMAGSLTVSGNVQTANLGVNGTLNVTAGSGLVATFSGSVQGANAAANNQFVTLGQANTLYAPGSGSGNYIKNQTALQTGNINIQSSSTSAPAGIFRAAAGQLSGNVFSVQSDAGTDMFAVDANGIFSMSMANGSSLASFSSAGSYVNSQTFGVGGYASSGAALQAWAYADPQIVQVLKLNSAASTGDFLQMRAANDTIVASFSKDGNFTTAGILSGNGSGLTTLNGSNISTGTIADARLSSNVALKNSNNNFTTSQTITGTVTATDFTGNGANLTSLNASNISSGTLADGRLSGNVALLNRNGQTFTGNDQLFRNGANSATALRIQNSAGETLFNADTTNQRLSVGTPTSAAKLTVSGDMDPWTARTAAEANSWQSVTYGNGLFVAVSSDGTNRVMTSPDGITWTARTALSSSWQSVTYSNGVFVAVSSSGASQVMTSPDGITWTARTAAVSRGWQSVTYGNGLFVAVAASGAASNRVMTSPDGITWTARTITSASWQSIAYGNGVFVAVSNASESSTSTDGINWTSVTIIPGSGSWHVSYGNNLFVAVAYARTSTSPDGITWTARTVPSSTWNSVAYGNGLFAAVSSSGTDRVITSLGGYSKAMTVNGGIDVSGTIRQNGYEVCTTVGNCGNSAANILQNGNSFGAGMTIGTNDNFGLSLITNGTARLTISNTGVATFTGAVTASSFTGDGAALTALNGGNISTGTVADGRLSSNVMLLNSNQTVTGVKTFTGIPVFDTGFTSNDSASIYGSLLVDDGLTVGGTNGLIVSSNYGATFNDGGINIANSGLSTAGTVRLTNAGVLQNVTANASIITAGTLADARLSTNVALLNRASQIFTGTNQTFRNSSNSTTALSVQNASSANVFAVDTTNIRIVIGAATAPTLASANLVVTNAEVQGTLRIGTSTNGVDVSGSGITLSGTARKTKKIKLTPEYSGAVLDGAGTGTMTAGHDATRRENYYTWTTTQTSSQSYDVVVSVPIPSDWSAWAPSNAFSVNTWTNSLTNSTGAVTVKADNGTNDINALSITPGSTSTWTTINASLTSSSIYVADGTMTIRLTLRANSGSVFQLGNVTLTYLSQF